MRVSSIHLKNFKRFTDLSITNVPSSAKVVLVVGPNGSGKSSLFDAFVQWYRYIVGFGADKDLSYFKKDPDSTYEYNRQVTIELYGEKQPEKNSLYVRTAYRNDPDFSISQFGKQEDPTSSLRISKSIQNDQTVAQNYQRLVYDTLTGVYDTSNDAKSVLALREELIGEVRASMRNVFGDLTLNSISDPLGQGAFTFEKGSSKSYHYKNLSGGEKAAFDLLLDIHIKKRYYADAIFCIDELETHLHTKVQGSLLKEIARVLPDETQLWVNTHSLGVLRAAQELAQQDPGKICLIDFDGVDPDIPAKIIPSNIGRVTWEKFLSIALDDLSERVAPEIVVVCEGSAIGNRRKDFDAEIYNRIFGHEYSNIVFVSGGSANQARSSAVSVESTLKQIIPSSRTYTLIDRDDRSDSEVSELEANGTIVLSKRNLESYLFADDILEALVNATESIEKLEEILQIKQQAIADSVARNNPADDLKSAAGQIYTELKRMLSLQRCGNNTDAFMRDTLVPLITPGMSTYEELKRDIADRIFAGSNIK